MLPAPLSDLSVRCVAFCRRVLVGPHVTAYAVRTPDGLLLFDADDDSVGGGLRLHGEWQPQCVAALGRVTRADSRVLVIGAHVGSFVVPLARRAHSVTALEPTPASFELLVANVRLAAATNVILHGCGASNYNGKATLFTTQRNRGGSRLLQRRPRGREQQHCFTVPVHRLDDLLDGQTFDVVMMDAEGHEPEILDGATNLMKDAHACLIEVHGSFLQDRPPQVLKQFARQLSEIFSCGREVSPEPGLSGWFDTRDLLEILRVVAAQNRITDFLLLRERSRWDEAEG